MIRACSASSSSPTGSAEPAEQQVVSLVERTTHHDFYKITVSQGIVIDPGHPGQATVFALVLDAPTRAFRRTLKDTFKDRVEENEIDPAVAMQLADIGQVVSLPPSPMAEVTIPSSTMALRAQPGRPTLEQERSDPVPDLPESPAGRPMQPRRAVSRAATAQVAVEAGSPAGGRRRERQPADRAGSHRARNRPRDCLAARALRARRSSPGRAGLGLRAWLGLVTGQSSSRTRLSAPANARRTRSHCPGPCHTFPGPEAVEDGSSTFCSSRWRPASWLAGLAGPC